MFELQHAWLSALRWPALAALAAVLSDCGWFGDNEGPKLPGTRVSVLSLERALVPDPTLADLEVRLPRPQRIQDWLQPGGRANHALQHLDMADKLRLSWQANAGEGASEERRLLSAPITGGGRVYTMDAVAQVVAFEFATGREIWRVGLTPDYEEEGVLGGGLAFKEGRIYASTGYGELVVLDAASGKQIWRRRVGAPIRGAPSVFGNRVFVIGHNNVTAALNIDDGKLLWLHEGLPETSGLVGGSTPAVAGGIVMIGYSSGELVAVKIENGRPLWGDQLVRRGLITPLASLSAIRALPVIDGDRVFAVSHSGRSAAYNLRTGRRLWERDFGGVEMPWIAGNFIYMVTSRAELVCLTRADGRVKWVTQLERYEDPEELEGLIVWSGPVLAANRLVVVSNKGKALFVSPYSGEVLDQLSLPGGTSLTPVVADGTLFVLTDGGELLAYR